MHGFSLLLGHILGDYVLQNDAMAAGKKTNSWVCLGHCLLYTFGVMCVTAPWLPPWAYLVILAAHFPVDRWLNVRWLMATALGQAKFAQPPLGPWSTILVDNAIHLAVLWLVGVVADDGPTPHLLYLVVGVPLHLWAVYWFVYRVAEAPEPAKPEVEASLAMMALAERRAMILLGATLAQQRAWFDDAEVENPELYALVKAELAEIRRQVLKGEMTSPIELSDTAERTARELIGLPEAARATALEQLRTQNPPLHPLVVAYLKEIRRQAHQGEE